MANFWHLAASKSQFCSLVFFCLALFLTLAEAARQKVTLFDGLNSQGSSHVTNTDISRLSIFNFDNRARSFCSDGIWLFYEHEDYNRQAGGYVQFRWGDNQCINLDFQISSRLSSLRHAGPYSNYRASSLTLYQNAWFAGDSFFIVGERKNLRRETRSLILTGNIPWTVYSGENFRGTPTCIFPGNNEAPKFVSDIASIGLERNSINSFRPGCWSNK